MPLDGNKLALGAGLGCGGAFVGCIIVANVVESLAPFMPDDRTGIAYGLYVGVPLGAYVGIRIVPPLSGYLAEGWQKLWARRR